MSFQAPSNSVKATKSHFHLQRSESHISDNTHSKLYIKLALL